VHRCGSRSPLPCRFDSHPSLLSAR
jgi:hypothetical protein